MILIAPYRTKRDLTSVLATDHNDTDVDPDINLSTSADEIFGDNTSCILWPNIDPLGEGPYCKHFSDFDSLWTEAEMTPHLTSPWIEYPRVTTN